MPQSTAFIVSTGCCALCLTLMTSPASGQKNDSSASVPPLVVAGFVDAYYGYNFADPKGHLNQLRNFDVTTNQFVISAAELSVTRAASPVGFRVDLDMGPANDIVQSNATGSVADIGQAYLTYVAPVGKGLTIDVGKFVTHMGFEVVKAKDDYNYSRSLLFALSIPYYHIGARAGYPVTNALTLTGFVLNCYNGVPINGNKTFGLAASVAAAGNLNVIFNWIGGPALPDSVSKKYRNTGEVIASFQATDQLSLSLDGVYGQDYLPSGMALWKGVAAYARLSVCTPSAFTLRGEIYNDPQGFTTGTTQTLKELTLTYEYRGLSNLILRPEYRYDWSDAAVYDSHSGTLSRTNQSTITIAGIVLF